MLLGARFKFAHRISPFIDLMATSVARGQSKTNYCRDPVSDVQQCGAALSSYPDSDQNYCGTCINQDQCDLGNACSCASITDDDTTCPKDLLKSDPSYRGLPNG